MDYPNRLEWQTRCEFNAYCKHTLRNELIDACRESKSRRKHEVNFSDLAPHEETAQRLAPVHSGLPLCETCLSSAATAKTSSMFLPAASSRIESG